MSFARRINELGCSVREKVDAVEQLCAVMTASESGSNGSRAKARSK